ncbi:MAG TPA: hypothetical protein DEQ03_07795, partial [Marinilabiliales bacterium]|nr:hypothetical protein [Marinilabiliales bacterium]
KGDLDLTDLDTGAKQAEGELMVIISDAMDGIILNQTAQFVGQYENIDGKASATVDTTINGVDVVAKINFSDKNLSRLEYKGRSHRMNCAK